MASAAARERRRALRRDADLERDAAERRSASDEDDDSTPTLLAQRWPSSSRAARRSGRGRHRQPLLRPVPARGDPPRPASATPRRRGASRSTLSRRSSTGSETGSATPRRRCATASRNCSSPSCRSPVRRRRTAARVRSASDGGSATTRLRREATEAAAATALGAQPTGRFPVHQVARLELAEVTGNELVADLGADLDAPRAVGDRRAVERVRARAVGVGDGADPGRHRSCETTPPRDQPRAGLDRGDRALRRSLTARRSSRAGSPRCRSRRDRRARG